MAQNELNVWNSALAKLGDKFNVQSLTEQSIQARLCNTLYEPARKFCLRIHPWNFATATVNLALLETASSPASWTYTYALPYNCLKARYIVNTATTSKIPFEVSLYSDGETRVIRTNQASPQLVYTVNITNVEIFDSMFFEALSYKMASDLCPTLAPSKSQEMLTKFVNAMKQAQTADASEGVAEPIETTDWLEVRVAGDSTVTVNNNNSSSIK